MTTLLSDSDLHLMLVAARQRVRSMWLGDDGRLRRGHSGDLVTMLDDLGVPTVSVMVFERPKPIFVGLDRARGPDFTVEYVSLPCAGQSRPLVRQDGGQP